MSPFVIHIVIINTLDLVGVILAKLWLIHRNPLLILGTMLAFGGAGYVFTKALRYEGMAIVNVLWISISVILVTIMGYFVFKENISITQFIGMGVILVGLILINV
jgi:multidrug transporter EmrE-like cation transporter